MPETNTPQSLVEALWQAFDRLDFDAVAPLLHDEFVCEWTQSNERIRGRDNFIAINKHYPGQWRITVQQMVVTDEQIVTEITASNGEKTDTAISFFSFKDGKIVQIREFWPDPYPAPAWRAQWVEQLEVR